MDKNQWISSILLLALTSFAVSSRAAAPARVRPYAESICNVGPDVFFCEDFEREDISVFANTGGPNCAMTWGNPAVRNYDGSRPANFCWAGGGSHQLPASPAPGSVSGNRVYRVSKTQGFVDVVTGRNTGTGSGTLSGWLDASLLGTAKREWFVRMQVWFSQDHTWPQDYDFKIFFVLPRDYPDPPSAAYEAGLYFHQDFACQINGSWTSFNDVLVTRYSGNFRQFPYQNEYCPPLSPGQAADGARAPRFQKGRWYTVEQHVRLAPDNTAVNGH